MKEPLVVPQNAHLLNDLLQLTEAPSHLPLHQQVYSKLKRLILGGQLAANARLPSSRQLATQLKLSRNTVSNAYDQLTAEGFIYSRHGSGSFVSQLSLQPQKNKAQPRVKAAKRLGQLEEEGSHFLGGLALVPGLIDGELFPYQKWHGLFKQQNQSLDDKLKQLDFNQGYEPLRQAIVDHVAISRGLQASKEQVFITAGAAQSLQLICQVLADPGDIAWMEDPGYTVAEQSLKLADMQLDYCPIDQHGLVPSPGSKPKLIYTTSSYQFPLGYTMPIQRRLELIALARQQQAWIIEDDYDGEFRYKGKPIPALFSQDDEQRCLYMGTFSKSLSPHLRQSYLIVPQALVRYFRHCYPSLGNESSIATQACLAEYIQRGWFARHIERLRKSFAARRHCLEQKLIQYCGVHPRQLNPGGLHLCLAFEDESEPRQREQKLLGILKQQGLGCLGLAEHYQQQSPKSGLLIGFTSCNEQRIAQAVTQLQAVMEQNHSRCYFL